MKIKSSRRIRNGNIYQKAQKSCEYRSTRDGAFKNMQKFVCLRQTAYLDETCHCQFCRLKKSIPLANKFNSISVIRRSNCLMKELIECLVCRGKKTMKIHIPDICFFQSNHVVAFYYTLLHDSTLRNFNGILTEKLLDGVFRKHKKKYLDSKKLFLEKEVHNINSYKQVHANFSETVLPAYFYEGMVSGVERSTILKQKRLIIHKQLKYHGENVGNLAEIDQDDSAYVVQYTDGNHQFISATQFSSFLMNRKSFGEMSYIKAYIKPQGLTSQQKSWIYEYKFEDELDKILFQHAQTSAGILLEEIPPSDERLEQQEIIEQQSIVMKTSPEKFMKMQCYRIVCYIQKSVGRKTRSMKTRWVLDDLGNYYLDDVLQWDYEKLKKRAPVPELAAHQGVIRLSKINPDENSQIQCFQDRRRPKQIQSLRTMGPLQQSKAAQKVQLGPSRRRFAVSKAIDRGQPPKQLASSETAVRKTVGKRRYRLEPFELWEGAESSGSCQKLWKLFGSK